MGEPENAERRREEREKRALACELVVETGRSSAVILDLSTSGLFVRTNLELEPGAPVVVRVRRPGGELWEIGANVARLGESDRKRASFSSRGLGLVISQAPEAYYAFVRSLAD